MCSLPLYAKLILCSFSLQTQATAAKAGAILNKQQQTPKGKIFLHFVLHYFIYLFISHYNLECFFMNQTIPAVNIPSKILGVAKTFQGGEKVV